MMRRPGDGPRLPKALLDQVGTSQQNHKQRRINHSAHRRHGRAEEARSGRHGKKFSNPDALSGAKLKSSGKYRHGGNKDQDCRAKAGTWEDDELSDGDLDTDSSHDDAEEDRIQASWDVGASKHQPDGENISATKRKDRTTEREDEEIAVLEKKLGIAGRDKLPHVFDEDGLGELLGDLGDKSTSSEMKRKRDEGKEWLEMKRRKRATGAKGPSVASGVQQEIDSDDDEMADGLNDLLEGASDDENMFSDSEVEYDTTKSQSSQSCGDNEARGASNESVKEVKHPSHVPEGEDYEEPLQPIREKSTRENPYVAPGASATKPGGKYIPPSLRATSQSDAEASIRLRRQAQGLLNKLSDANVISILGDVEDLYARNPRQYVTTALIDLLLALITDRTVLNDTFIILHAGFITAVYKVIGADFGAQLLERIVHAFDEEYASAIVAGSGTKAPVNLMSTLTQLYNFQMIGCALVFDYIRAFLETLSETNTELLLRVVRLSGNQLRSDDSSALKDIVLLLQKTVAKEGEANLSVRTKFMIETIDDLKNNRLKTGAIASAITADHAHKMKRTIGTLNQRSLKATEPLRITLSDIKDTEKKGKWWLVGASWKGSGETAKSDSKVAAAVSRQTMGDDDDLELEAEVPLDILAKSQGMNNPVRRAIFVAVLSAVDPGDAWSRILRLNLKRKQESEIPHVLQHCAGAEASYNPYYAVIARRVCVEMPKLKRKFEFALWDLFKRMGENNGDDEDSPDEDDKRMTQLSMSSLVSYAKFYADLVLHNSVPITVLKVLDLMRLQTQAAMFIEVFLITLILSCAKKQRPSRKTDHGKLYELFRRVSENPQLAAGLQFLLSKHISKTDLTANKIERKKVASACHDLVQLLQADEQGEDNRLVDDDRDDPV